MDCHAQIILEDKSRNTDENLKYSAEIIKQLGVKHVVIVTSNSHMERSMNFARQYIPKDIKVYAYPSGGYRPKKEMKLLSTGRHSTSTGSSLYDRPQGIFVSEAME